MQEATASRPVNGRPIFCHYLYHASLSVGFSVRSMVRYNRISLVYAVILAQTQDKVTRNMETQPLL